MFLRVFLPIVVCFTCWFVSRSRRDQDTCRASADPHAVTPSRLGVCTLHPLLGPCAPNLSSPSSRPASLACIVETLRQHLSHPRVPASLRDSPRSLNKERWTEQKQVLKVHFGPFPRNALEQPVGQGRKNLLFRPLLFCFLSSHVCVAGLSSPNLKAKPLSLHRLEIKT